MDRLAPNPSSPYADADPQYRHIIPSFFGLMANPGSLSTTACGRLAVVPTEPLRDVESVDSMPPGMCPTCWHVAMEGGIAPEWPIGRCRECGTLTRHDGLCAVCRREAHETATKSA